MPINVCLINLVKMDYKTKTSSYLVLQGLAICGWNKSCLAPHFYFKKFRHNLNMMVKSPFLDTRK